MPPKGRYTKRSPGTRYTSAMKDVAAKKIQAVVRKAIANNNKKTMEVKQAVSTISDGLEIYHNNFITLDSHLLETTQGVKDPNTSHTECRIGDQITLRGCKIKMMVELNSRYSDVTYRLLVVKCAKGDSPTRATLFCGLSGNKMLDTINKERYTVLFQKYFKIKAGNHTISNSNGAAAEVGTTLPPSNAGIQYTGGSDVRTMSRSTKIIKAWIPGKAFAKNGIIQYENNGHQVKFFDYQVLLYAYSNYGTDQDIWYVGRCNDYINQLYFTDA